MYSWSQKEHFPDRPDLQRQRFGDIGDFPIDLHLDAEKAKRFWQELEEHRELLLKQGDPIEIYTYTQKLQKLLKHHEELLFQNTSKAIKSDIKSLLISKERYFQVLGTHFSNRTQHNPKRTQSETIPSIAILQREKLKEAKLNLEQNITFNSSLYDQKHGLTSNIALSESTHYQDQQINSKDTPNTRFLNQSRKVWVTHHRSSKPIQNAQITITNLGIKYISGPDHSITLKNLEAGNYDLKIAAEGHNTLYASLYISNNQEDATFELTSKDFSITKIPRIMGFNSWPTGKKLMEHWFNNNAYTLPTENIFDPSTPFNGHTITLDWILGFERAKDVYDQMWNEKIWTNQSSKKQLISMLKEENLFTDKKEHFGTLGRDANGHTLLSLPLINDRLYFQQREVTNSNPFRSIDDLDAALANFTFNMAADLSIEPNHNTGGYTIKLNKVGVYAVDKYDFNDDSWFGSQHLGNWDDEYNTVSYLFNYNLGEKVVNKDFRDWRSEHNKGGDFVIYSDIEIRDVHDIIEVSPDDL